MRILKSAAAGAFLLALTGAAPPQTTPAPAPAAAANPLIEPGALDALRASRAYLRTLKSFELRLEGTRDEVIGDDMKVELTNQARYNFVAPDKLFIDWRSDRLYRRLYFDGKNVTLYAPRMGYYATVAAPGTVEKMLVDAAVNYGIVFPIPDILLWAARGPEEPTDLQQAIHVGYARIAGAETDHYLFRQADLDWQVWIERGERPLPRKIVITDRTDPLQPKFSALLAWNPNVSIPPATFTFVPPDGTKRIPVVKPDADTEASQ